MTPFTGLRSVRAMRRRRRNLEQAELGRDHGAIDAIAPRRRSTRHLRPEMAGKKGSFYFIGRSGGSFRGSRRQRQRERGHSTFRVVCGIKYNDPFPFRMSACARITFGGPSRLPVPLASANRPEVLSVVGHLPRRRGCIRRTGSAGVGQRSREETAGRTRLGGAARSVYGDLRAAGQLSRVAGAAGWLGSDWRRHRQGGLMATSGRCRRVSQVVPCALDGVAASGIVAAGERRQ